MIYFESFSDSSDSSTGASATTSSAGASTSSTGASGSSFFIVSILGDLTSETGA